MHEILDTIEQTRYAAPAAGAIFFGAGLLVDRVVNSKAQRKENEILETSGFATQEAFYSNAIIQTADVTPDIKRKATPWEKTKIAAAAFMAPVALGGFGFAAEQALFQPSDKTPEVPVSLQFVADHSYQASLGGKNAPSIKIDALSNTLASSDYANKFTARAIMTSGGTTSEPKMAEVSKQPYIGSAVLPDALNTAITSAISSQPGEAHSRNAGILVATNGNSIGNVQSIVKQAKGSAEVFIVDADSKTDSATEATFKRIAESTGGELFTAKDFDSKKVLDTIHDSLNTTTTDTHENKNNDRLNWILMTGIAALTSGMAFVNRSRRYFGRGIDNLGKEK